MPGLFGGFGNYYTRSVHFSGIPSACWSLLHVTALFFSHYLSRISRSGIS